MLEFGDPYAKQSRIPQPYSRRRILHFRLPQPHEPGLHSDGARRLSSLSRRGSPGGLARSAHFHQATSESPILSSQEVFCVKSGYREEVRFNY